MSQGTKTRAPQEKKSWGPLGRLFGHGQDEIARRDARSEPSEKSALDLGDIQGFILRGYRMPMVRHFLLTVSVPAAARQLLGRLVVGDESDAPQITTAEDWHVGFAPGPVGGQDFSLQNTKTLPINDSTAFLAIMKLLTASNRAAGMWSLPFRDKLRMLRTLALVQVQMHQKIKPYQQLRYRSNVPFRHGPIDIVKYSATPHADNPACPLERSNPKGLQDELIRHLKEDGRMSGFDFGVQFLDSERMTYWSKHQDPNFWVENASIDWKETEAPFHTVARLTLLRNSQLLPDADEATNFDATGNVTPDSTPIGSINRARWPSEVASRKARARVQDKCERASAASCSY